MPFNNVNELPSTLKKVLPVSAQKVYLGVFNTSYDKNKSDAFASQVAWGVVKKKFKKSGKTWVARSEDFVAPELFVFDVEATGNEIVMNDENGNLIMDAVLASTAKNKAGHYFDIEDLEKIADQINTGGSTLPDVKHETLDSITSTYLSDYLSDEQLAQQIRNRKGVFTDIKALVKEGKLWIRAKLDKRYKNHVDKFKGLSIETIAKRQMEGNMLSSRLSNPLYLGFTFTDNPQLTDAVIAK